VPYFDGLTYITDDIDTKLYGGDVFELTLWIMKEGSNLLYRYFIHIDCVI
jgi:hypothetical protein